MEGEARDEAPLTLGVSCLMSYEHTGAVALACERGCTCKPRSVPCLWGVLFPSGLCLDAASLVCGRMCTTKCSLLKASRGCNTCPQAAV